MFRRDRTVFHHSLKFTHFICDTKITHLIRHLNGYHSIYWFRDGTLKVFCRLKMIPTQILTGFRGQITLTKSTISIDPHTMIQCAGAYVTFKHLVCGLHSIAFCEVVNANDCVSFRDLTPGDRGHAVTARPALMTPSFTCRDCATIPYSLLLSLIHI